MKVAEIDRGFVRAAPDRVFDLVRDPTRYPEWWPRVRSTREGSLRLPELGEVRTDVRGVNEGVELIVEVEGGGVRGHLQWYLQPFKDGTIVYAITDVETSRRWSSRRVLRHRASIRRAMVALKNRLED
jgi:polyketide cyclase/dehydrase/lipid transport protein